MAKTQAAARERGGGVPAGSSPIDLAAPVLDTTQPAIRLNKCVIRLSEISDCRGAPQDSFVISIFTS
jgi:hypothetical protein